MVFGIGGFIEKGTKTSVERKIYEWREIQSRAGDQSRWKRTEKHWDPRAVWLTLPKPPLATPPLIAFLIRIEVRVLVLPRRYLLAEGGKGRQFDNNFLAKKKKK